MTCLDSLNRHGPWKWWLMIIATVSTWPLATLLALMARTAGLLLPQNYFRRGNHWSGRQWDDANAKIEPDPEV